MTNYLITIADETNDSFVAHGYGDFSAMRFLAKSGLAAIDGKDGDFRARVVEVEEIGVEPADNARVVCSVGGDAETVAVVLKKKIATERKRENPTDETASETVAE